MIKRLKCLFGYHKYFVLIELTKWTRKLGCRNCKKCFAMNDSVGVIVPWDEDFERLYRQHGILK